VFLVVLSLVIIKLLFVKFHITEYGPLFSHLVDCVVLCIVCVDCVVLYIVCVYMCNVLLPPGVNPIALKNI
jgi:hypothetical protein